MDIKKAFEEINIDVDKVSDPHLKTIIIKLLNIADQAVFKHQVDTSHAALTEATSKNSVLAHEKWILGQEKSQLFGQLKQIESSL